MKTKSMKAREVKRARLVAKYAAKRAELKAYHKNQIWMWDITWLKSPVTGIWYYAYVIEDLYDRSIVAWMIFENESDEHSRELFSCISTIRHFDRKMLLFLQKIELFLKKRKR